MGAESSTELPRPFAEIAKWPKSRVDSVVQQYMSGEFDFGVDCSAVMTITGLELDESKELLAALSKNESGIINAIVLLISIIVVGNNENRNEVGRMESIFDLMDFNGAGKISSDELTILLLCTASAFTFILEGRVSDERSQQYEQNVMQLAKQLLLAMNKKPYGNSSVKKEDFCASIKERFFSNGIVTMKDLFAAAAQTAPKGPDHAEGEEHH